MAGREERRGIPQARPGSPSCLPHPRGSCVGCLPLQLIPGAGLVESRPGGLRGEQSSMESGMSLRLDVRGQVF